MAPAQQKLTERTVSLESGKPRPTAALADASWLEGHWTAQALGGACEEIWTGARGGAMLGMFRLIVKEKPVFYEIFTLTEEAGSLMLRLKHFHANLSGWEDKDKTVDFPLAANAAGTLQFDGLTYQRTGKDALTTYLAIKRGGNIHEETFRFARLKR